MKKLLFSTLMLFCINSFAMPQSPYNFKWANTNLDLSYQSQSIYFKGSQDKYIYMNYIDEFNNPWIVKYGSDGYAFACVYPELYTRSKIVLNKHIHRLVMEEPEIQLSNFSVFSSFKTHFHLQNSISLSLIAKLPHPTLATYFESNNITTRQAATIIANTKSSIELAANALRNCPNAGLQDTPYQDDFSFGNFLIDPKTLKIYVIDFGNMSYRFEVENFQDFSEEVYAQANKQIKPSK